MSCEYSAAVLDWHRALNVRTWDDTASATRFGLTERTEPAVELPETVWATQFAAPRIGPPVIRVGIAGHRLHVGHFGLARDVVTLAARAQGTTVALFEGADARASDLFESLLRRMASTPPNIVRVDQATTVAHGRRLLEEIRFREIERIYGWAQERIARLDEVSLMLGFMFHSGSGIGQPGAAFVDANQVTHSAVAKLIARRTALEPPWLLYRRLMPSMRGSARRASAKSVGSTAFLDEDQAVMETLLRRATTGGKSSASQQRECGGSPTDCPFFSLLERTHSRSAAGEALLNCEAGSVTCAECKAAHAPDIIRVLRGRS